MSRKKSANTKTVCIVGSHPCAADFDYSRADCDIWVFNEFLAARPQARATAVFQLHNEAIFKNPNNRNDPNHYEWLKTQDSVPAIYMQAHYDEIPASVAYPIDEISARFGRQYFTSSVAYAIALAIYQGYGRIEVYGVQMETATEYQHQQAGFAYWLGVATGAGAEVITDAKFLVSPLYGYTAEVQINVEKMRARVAELRPMMEQAHSDYMARRDATQKALHHFTETGAEQAANGFVDALRAQAEAGVMLAQIDGALQENEKYIKKAEAMTETAGDHAFSMQEFEQSGQNANKERIKAEQSHYGLSGRLSADFARLRTTRNLARRRRDMAGFLPAVDAYLKAAMTAGLMLGVVNENAQYMNELNQLIRMSGGQTAAQILTGE